MRGFKLACITLGATVLLLIAGGLVHSTGSALACPDWPLCYGDAFPEMTGGVLFEHGHRMIAGTVAFLTLVLAFLLVGRWEKGSALWRAGLAAMMGLLAEAILASQAGLLLSEANRAGVDAGSKPWLLFGLAAAAAVGVVTTAILLGRKSGDWIPALGLIAAQIVEFQAILGAITVFMRLPRAVSTSHLATSMIFFATLVFFVFALRPGARRDGARIMDRKWLAVMVGAVYGQILLGAWVRHTGSGLACNVNILTCDGALLPTTGPGWLHFSHRIMALVVTGIVIFASVRALRAAREKGRPLVRFFAIATHVLVVAQVLLGVLTVTTYISIPMATSHLTVGALLFAGSFALFLSAGPLGEPVEGTVVEHALAEAAG